MDHPIIDKEALLPLPSRFGLGEQVSCQGKRYEVAGVSFEIRDFDDDLGPGPKIFYTLRRKDGTTFQVMSQAVSPVPTLVDVEENVNQVELEDTFKGDDVRLLDSIRSLVSLSDAQILVPHGLPGLARTLLASAWARLRAYEPQYQVRMHPADGWTDSSLDRYNAVGAAMQLARSTWERRVVYIKNSRGEEEVKPS